MGIFFCIVFQGYFKFSRSYITLLLLSHIYCDSVSKFSNTTNQQLHIIATTTLLCSNTGKFKQNRTNYQKS
jgi:hypothetical protein